MNPFVLDASTAVAWCFEEAQTPYAISILDMVSEGAEAHVPLIWGLEVTNALVKALHVLSLAERYQLTTYDASYLELAQRRGLAIATTDGNLIQAAGAVKVPVLIP